MPTKKTRVGFIPRNDVLDILRKLSYENNLSYSKIINILVEEALYNRGYLKKNFYDDINDSDKFLQNQSKVFSSNNKKGFVHALQNRSLDNKKNFLNDDNYEPLDIEIYEKFLMFLEFQNKMREINS